MNASHPEPTGRGERGWALLALVLLAAAAVRVAPAALERQAGRDLIEYRNIAANLGAGRGLTLDIKSYYQIETEVSHYAGYDRAPLLPALLWLMERAVSAESAGQWIGPLLMLGMLALFFETVRLRFGASAAFWSSLLLALHPGLLGISLTPLTEILVLFCLALAVWGFDRLESPAVSGLACALAFLARPSGGIIAGVLGAAWLLRARGKGSWKSPLVFGLAFLIGPITLVALNLAYGAPAFQTPQNFLFRVLHFSQGQQFFHQTPVYDSTAALLGAQGGAVLRRIAKNGFYYLESLGGSAQGLGFLLALVPVAAWGLAKSGGQGRRTALALAAIALLDLALYTVTWSTFDAPRFLAVPLMAGVGLIALGTWRAFELWSERGLGGARRIGAAALLTVALAWGGVDLHRSYLAVREYQTGRPMTNNVEALWNLPEVEEMRGVLASIDGRNQPVASTTFASNEPWLTHTLTGGPAAFLPYDLEDEEWLPFLAGLEAPFVLIHAAAWPEEFAERRASAERVLGEAGWIQVRRAGVLTLWAAP